MAIKFQYRNLFLSGHRGPTLSCWPWSQDDLGVQNPGLLILTLSNFTFLGPQSSPYMKAKGSQLAGLTALDTCIHTSNKYLLSTCVQKLCRVYDCLFALKAPEEILEAMGILENQAPVECQEAWGTWGCQVMCKILLRANKLIMSPNSRFLVLFVLTFHILESWCKTTRFISDKCTMCNQNTSEKKVNIYIV